MARRRKPAKSRTADDLPGEVARLLAQLDRHAHQLLGFGYLPLDVSAEHRGILEAVAECRPAYVSRVEVAYAVEALRVLTTKLAWKSLIALGEACFSRKGGNYPARVGLPRIPGWQPPAPREDGAEGYDPMSDKGDDV